MVVKTGGRGPGHTARTPPGPAAAAMTLSGLSTPEDSTAGTLIGVLGTVGTTGTPVFALTDNAGGKAALSGANVNRGATALSYATAQFFDITVTVTGVTPVISATTFRIAVVATAVTLNALTLSANAIAENSAAGTVVGAVQGKTAGSTLSLTDSAGSRFALSGANLVAGATATDYETATSHSVTLRETLAGATNSPRDTVLSVIVTDVSEGGGFSFTPFAYYDETSVVQTAGAVTQWSDLGARGVHFVQATAGSQPVYEATGVDGKPAIKFNGAAGLLQYLETAPVDLSHTKSYAVFMRTLADTNVGSQENYSAIGVSMWSTEQGNSYYIPNARFARFIGATYWLQHSYGTPDNETLAVAHGAPRSIGGAVYGDKAKVYDLTGGVASPGTNTFYDVNFPASARLVLGCHRDNGAINGAGWAKHRRLIILDFMPTPAQIDEVSAWLAG